MATSSDATDEPGKAAASSGWTERLVRFLKGRSLDECVESRRDNILHLRLLAALMVVFGHSYAIFPKVTATEPLHQIFPATYTSLLGVMMFFMISGFLITMSYMRRPQLFRFMRARVLRLWPALFVCAAAWAFVLGPLLSDFSLREYFTASGRGTPYTYAWGAATIFWPRQVLPGLFMANPVAGQVNVSVWTIPYEATMYLWVAGAGALGLFRFPRLTSAAIAVLFGMLLLWPMWIGKVPYNGGILWIGLTLQGFFGAGAIACLMRRYIPISTGLMIVIAGACFLSRTSTHAMPFMWLAVGYFVLWFAYVPRLPAVPRELDLSYGTYLWAFPVQQSVILLAGVSNPLILFAIVVPIVLPIAAASWLFVEKPALKFKDWRWRRATRLQPA
ncbi:MAG: acyltransferase family protein [Rhodanobacteraceae bacterium]